MCFMFPLPECVLGAGGFLFQPVVSSGERSICDAAQGTLPHRCKTENLRLVERKCSLLHIGIPLLPPLPRSTQLKLPFHPTHPCHGCEVLTNEAQVGLSAWTAAAATSMPPIQPWIDWTLGRCCVLWITLIDGHTGTNCVWWEGPFVLLGRPKLAPG